MNILLILCTLLFNISQTENIHNFKIKALNSEEVIDLSDYYGKKILIVNVASKCGYVGQYEDLQRLHQTYQDELVVIGFPCNQFMGQEPGTEEEIAGFCKKQYGVSFPMTTKINVKGKNQHPIYQWLTQKEKNGLDDFKVSWNFNKFLIDENGKLVAYFPASVEPYDDKILNYLD